MAVGNQATLTLWVDILATEPVPLDGNGDPLPDPHGLLSLGLGALGVIRRRR